ncbi:speckle-type POZ protein B-like [Aphidius gifuensis]|uniref:speckle-type POZ protein B-like n=1 Tax=Aphidius gifuensis TaxID=684658 RepID=UPI001CDC2314|nr:speckle-type POZ protein B-like [Aphidius gifuensis]
MTNSVGRIYRYVTERKTRSVKYEWLIKDYSFYGNEVLESSTFSSGMAEIQDEWTLQMDLRPQPDTDDVKILLKLKSLENNPNFLAVYNVSILSYETKQKKHTFFESPEAVKFSIIDYTEVSCSFQRSTLKDYSSNDTLLISCELKTSTNEPVVNQPIMANICENVDIAERHLKDTYAELLKSGISSDVIIKVKTKSFKAIKGILVAHSPVFSAMFNHDEVKENTENKVIVEDIDEDVFEQLLYYMYTGEVKNIQDMPMDLLIAADKYQLDHLKNQCEETLLSSIDTEKAAEFFVFAEKNNAENLKHGTIKFIKSHLQKSMTSKTFTKMQKEESRFLCRLLQYFDGSE